MNTNQIISDELLEARIAVAEQIFQSGSFGSGHESAGTWFLENGDLIKPFQTRSRGQLFQLEARVGFMNGTAKMAYTSQFNVTEALSTDEAWRPMFTKWRHGGWYVHGIRYPNGGCGCVSNNYEDGKWRIACDPRRTEIGGPGDFTFKSRNDAAHGERALIRDLTLEMLAKRTPARNRVKPLQQQLCLLAG